MIRALLIVTAIAAAPIGAVTIGAAATASLPKSWAAPFLICYTNSDGDCIPEPSSAPTAPPGATAHCIDGTWSQSKHIKGTCSGHGGVDYWITDPTS